MRLHYLYFTCGNGAANAERLTEKAVGVNDRVADGAGSRPAPFSCGRRSHVWTPFQLELEQTAPTTRSTQKPHYIIPCGSYFAAIQQRSNSVPSRKREIFERRVAHNVLIKIKVSSEAHTSQ